MQTARYLVAAILCLAPAVRAAAPQPPSPECLRKPARVDATADPDSRETWTIKLTWSGGFAGRPPTTITVTSSGHAIAAGGAGCLTAGDRESVAQLLEIARPDSWHACYGTEPCCDKFAYTLDLDQPRDRRAYRVGWFSGDALPDDLRAMVNLLDRIGRARIPACPAR